LPQETATAPYNAAAAGRGDGSGRGRGRVGGRGRGMVGRTSIQYRYNPGVEAPPPAGAAVDVNQVADPAAGSGSAAPSADTAAISSDSEKAQMNPSAPAFISSGPGRGGRTGNYFRGSGGRGRGAGRVANKTWVREATSDTPLVSDR
jgi:hypothetical protein